MNVQSDHPGQVAGGVKRAGGRRGWGAFGAAGFAVFALLLGSNLPNSLFPLYAKVYGLSPVGVTLLFATYTLLVIPAVLAFGPLSDVKGRRELLIAAIVVAGVAAGLFAAAQTVVVLFIAQAIQAMALGINYRLTGIGADWFRQFGIDLDALTTQRRPLIRYCTDWSEQRHHLAGALGAAIAERLLAQDWIKRAPSGRAVRLTDTGRQGLNNTLGICVDDYT